MGIISWLLVGLIAGLLAKLIMPGKEPGGIIITILLGIGGGFLGGYIASRLGIGSVNALNITSILIATGGAILILILYKALKR
jgi:uncharacterized membrane protein YeaQ/YmgE (transglycosylase-associated protein family)